jgi:hypothetical protein
MEEEYAKIVTCSRCKKKVHLNDIRYASDGKSLICSTCHLAQTDPKKTEHIFKQKAAEPAKPVSTVVREMGCSKCGYRYKIRDASNVKKKECPYCGSDKVIDLKDKPFG